MIKAVIFDLDNTLYDYDECNAPAMKKAAEIGSKLFDCTEEKFLAVNDEAKILVKRQMNYNNAAQHSRVFYFQKTAELFGVSPAKAVLPLYNAYWDTFIDAMQPYDDAISFVTALKAKGIKTAICSDMTALIQFRKIEKLGLTDLIDCVLTSEETETEKPSPVNFHHTLDKLATRPEETIYIGDSVYKDIDGALGTAIRPVLFTAKRQYEPKEGVLTVADYGDKRLWTLCGLEQHVL